MSVSISHEPRPTEWITLNGVAVNLAQVTSIAFSPQTGVLRGGVLAVVYLPSFTPGRIDPPNTTSFEITDSAVADQLRSYTESRRFQP
jgi:hypothetical protein